MPPKKKKAEEQKKKIIEDKTFGLKNKKKSKKVQQYVETVKKQANQKVDGIKRKGGASASGASAASAARMAQMQARLAELELMNQPVKDKPKKMSEAEAEKKRLEEEEEAERIRIANLPVEDQIEEERVKLKTKTPVTLDRFMKWREEKKKERKAKEDVKKAAAFKKMSKAERSRGQGLTGKELFQAHADIFVDDENAVDEKLQPINDYIGADEEEYVEEETEEIENDTAVVAPGDASLFGGEETPGAGPSTAPPQAVAVGDESLFS